MNFPITLRVSCGESQQILNVSNSGEIFFGKNCQINKHKDAWFNEQNTTIVKVESSFVKPTFELLENDTWINENIFSNSLNRDVDELMRDAQALKGNFEQRSTMVDLMDLDPFSRFSDFFDKMMYYAIISIVTFIFCILIIIALCFVCRK